MAGEETRRRIVDGAFAYLDEVGLDGFSMRALAERLDMGTMSVYRYFSSKDDLIEAVRLKLRASYDNAPVPGERWDDTIHRTVSSIRKNALEHPNIWIAQRGLRPSTKPHTRRIYCLHKDQGIPIEIYRKLWSIIEAYLSGFISHEIASANIEYERVDEDDPDYPWLMIAEDAYGDESFEAGIDIIIEGVRKEAAPDPCEWYTPVDCAAWTWSE